MATSEITPSDEETIAAIARRHGLALAGDIELNDIGLDFRVAFATDEAGRPGCCGIPRRPDVLPRAENEARVLRLLKGRLPVEVPDWRIVTPELIAYPRLAGTTAVTVDPATKEPTWNIDKESPAFVESFARTLAALHGIDPAEAAAAGLKVSSPEEARRAFADDVDRVKREIGIGEVLWRRWRAWLDDDASWPPFTTLVHGDLHVGHVLVDETSRATGVLDWTEAEVSDPAIDFIFHLHGVRRGWPRTPPGRLRRGRRADMAGHAPATSARGSPPSPSSTPCSPWRAVRTSTSTRSRPSSGSMSDRVERRSGGRDEGSVDMAAESACAA